MEHNTVTSRDGTTLAVRCWPRESDAKAPVLLVHGLAEHLGRYGHVAEALHTAGFSVTGLELRGHGHSEGKRGHVMSWSEYGDDLVAGLNKIGEPCFIVAHSMGGLVSLHALLERPGLQVRGVVVSNPFLGLGFEPPKLKVIGGRLLSRVLPSLSMTNELDTKHLTHDLDVVRRYEEDPLVFNTITPRWFTEAMKAMERVHAQAARFQLPLLVLLGDQDKLTAPAQGHRFFDAAGSADKTRIVYEGFYHELFNELEKARVLADVTAWLSERC